MVRAVHGRRSSAVLYRALLLLLSLCVASSQDGTDSTCFGGSCAEPAPGAAQFRSAAAADEELHSRERTERERVLQQKLLSGQRRRQSAFVGRNAVGSVADSWGRERTGSAAPPQQREAPPTPPPPPPPPLEQQQSPSELSVGQFLHVHKQLLSDFRLNTTGTRERPAKQGFQAEVKVPQGLVPGDSFKVSVEDIEYPVVVPEGTYGGHRLNVVFEGIGEQQENDFRYLLHTAAKDNSALEIGEVMAKFFMVAEAQAFGCQAVQHVLDNSATGGGGAPEKEQRGLERRSGFASVDMVRLLVRSIRHHQHSGANDVSMMCAQAIANLCHEHKNNTQQAADAGVAALMVDLIGQHAAHQQIPRMALGALVNMCGTSAGTAAVQTAMDQSGLQRLFRVLDLHSANAQVLTYGCMLLFRIVQELASRPAL